MIMKKKILMGRNQHGIRGFKTSVSQKGYCTENANELLDFADIGISKEKYAYQIIEH